MEKKLQLLPLSEHEAGVLRKFLKSIIPLFKEAKVSGFMEQTMLGSVRANARKHIKQTRERS